MKISICDCKKRFVIRLPLSFLKSGLVCSALKKNMGLPTAQSEESEDECLFQDEDLQEIETERRGENAVCQPDEKQKLAPTPAFMKEIYAVLRRCVKENGHFVLLDVQSGDGEKVKITI